MLNDTEEQILITIAHYLISEPNNPMVFRSSRPPCISREILDLHFGHSLTKFTLFGLVENGLVGCHSSIENGYYLTAQATVGLMSQRLIHTDYTHLIGDLPIDGVYLDGAGDDHQVSAEEVQAILDSVGQDFDLWAARHWRKPSFLNS